MRKASKPAARSASISSAVADAALRHAHHAGRNAINQLKRSLHPHLKRLQVAIVHADRVGAVLAERIEHRVQFARCVHFDQHIQRNARAPPRQTASILHR